MNTKNAGLLSRSIFLIFLLWTSLLPCHGAELVARPGLDQIGSRESVWRCLFDTFNLPVNGTVIEVSPGTSTSVGCALSLMGFKGSLFVVESDQRALADLVAQYRSFMPQARVVAVPASPWDDAADLPVGADALVSHQFLEDLIIKELLPRDDWNRVGGDRSSAEARELVARSWKRIEEDRERIGTLQQAAKTTWNTLIGKLDPKLVLISQSDHSSLLRDCSPALDSCVTGFLHSLAPVTGMPRLIEQRLLSRGLEPARWLVDRRTGLDAEGLSRMIPGAVERLGSSTFVTMDAYRVDPAKVHVLYVQNDILGIWSGRPVRDDQAKAFVEKNLVLSLDPRDGMPGVAPVKVYVDRQADPMNMSLTGNLGSGRAAYAGDRFNLKGIGKTVLATSRDPLHSNGVVDMVSALWEMICSNSLQANIRTETSPVLAVIDTHKQVQVQWVDQKVPGGIIVRLTDHGELDRPTHLFYRNKPVPAERLRSMARRFGMQDAEKFIERILHGGWSAGNISLDGHLIDYETVFAVRGRAPQWSYRPNWLSDFFGLEWMGQKELLKALANHPINADRISTAELHWIFDTARRARLEQRFLDLVGVSPSEFAAHLPTARAAVSDLVTRFESLSMKMFPNFRATAAFDEENTCLSVYDMSRFFRLYPILRRTRAFDEEAALRLMRNPDGKLKWSLETRERGMPPSIENALGKGYVVSSSEQLKALDTQALVFIRKYEDLLTMINREIPGESGANIARAYVVNEERAYMNSMPGNDVLVALVQRYGSGRLSPARFSELLELLVEANDRIPRYDAKGRCQADLRLFLDGYVSNLIGMNATFQPRLTFLHTPIISEIGQTTLREIQDRRTGSCRRWEVEFAGKRYPCSIERDGGRTHLVGPVLPLSRLVNESGKIAFFCGEQQVRLQPITRTDRTPEPTPTH